MSDASVTYDVFLSYNWREHATVEAIARALRERGLSVFLDRWYLVPGRSWPQALEGTLDSCHAVAVFLGPHGMGPWQQREKDLALDRQARSPTFPVIPVLLSGADPALGFLSLNTWVDLRTGLDDPLPLAVLMAAVRGEPPGPALQERLTATLATVCPYRGLRPFREEDAAFFFGREAFTARLAEAVERHALVAVVGASGSGKSSVVRAGLVPHLRRRDSGRVWEIATLLPSDRPLHALAAALLPLLEPEMTETDRLAEVGKLAGYLAAGQVTLRDVVARALEKQPGTDRLLLVIDQWEELYTLVQDEQVRRCFLDEVLAATVAGSLSIVLTLRGDFFGHALGYRPLADRLQDAVVTLGPMTREELERAVDAPVHKVGLTFETGLVGRMLDSVGEEPGNLPLLEFALTELWEARHGGMLLHAAYEAMGEVQGAISRRAEEVFERLTSLEQNAVQRVFMQLVRPGEQTEDTRRRTTFAEVGEPVRPAVQRLADARLVVTGHDQATGEDTIEVAHEALIRTWTRLRGWLDADREFLLWRHRLRTDLADWERTGRDEGTLLRGAPLAEAERWLAARSDDLGPAERGFIQESVALREQERAARDRQRRRLAQAAVGVAAVFLILAGVAGWQWWQVNAQRQVAEHQRQLALSRQLAAQSTEYASRRPDLSVLLALASTGASNALEARDALFAALVRTNYPMKTLRDSAGSATVTLKFSPDGQILAAGTHEGGVIFWDYIHARQLANKKGHNTGVTTLAFSPDRSTLASGADDGTVILWDMRTFDQKRVLNADAGRVLAIAFSKDGTAVRSVSERAAILWRVRDGEPLRMVPVENVSNNRVALSPDGTKVALGGDWVGLWDIDTDVLIAQLKPLPARFVKALAFSQQEGTITTFDSDGTIIKWDVETGQELHRVGKLGGVDTGVEGIEEIAISTDGNFLATRGTEVTFWDLSHDTKYTAPVDTSRPARCIAMSHDAQKLAWCSSKGSVVLWERSTLPMHRRLTSKDLQVVGSIAFSPDGTKLASGDTEGRVLLWDVARGQQISILQANGLVVGSIAFSSTNKLAAGMRHGRVTVWDTSRPEEKRVLPEGSGVLGSTVTFSRDGTRLASATDNKITLWDMTTWQPAAQLENQSISRGIVINPNDTVLASANSDGSVTLWDMTKYHRIAVLQGHRGEVMGIAFSPDGKRLASAGRDGTVIVWGTDTRKEVNRFGGLDEIYSIAFSPDNRMLAYGSDNNSLILRDIQNSQKILAIREYHTEVVSNVVFSPDGRSLASADRGSIHLWHILDLEVWKERACAAVGRNLTREEWRLFVGEGQAYQTVCPLYPVMDK